LSIREGVTVIVAITGSVVILVAVNAAISPVPLAGRFWIYYFVQAYVVPVPVKLISCYIIT
jgi:hypothetical protein